jgi:hypothetical protein
MWLKKLRYASNPPADAPIATMSSGSVGAGSAGVGSVAAFVLDGAVWLRAMGSRAQRHPDRRVSAGGGDEGK